MVQVCIRFADTTQGDEEYLRLVNTLPPSLLNEAPLALSQMQVGDDKPMGLPSQSAVSIFASRLTFLAEFRDYLLFVRQSDKEKAANRLVDLLRSNVAPVGVWAVLLVESIALLEGESHQLSDSTGSGLISYRYRDPFHLERFIRATAYFRGSQNQL
jgi:hypothetical protein